MKAQILLRVWPQLHQQQSAALKLLVDTLKYKGCVCVRHRPVLVVSV